LEDTIEVLSSEASKVFVDWQYSAISPLLLSYGHCYDKKLMCNTKEESFVKERIPEPDSLNE